MGFRLVSAQAIVMDGQPAVEMRLATASHYATVEEEHAAVPTPVGTGGGPRGCPSRQGTSRGQATYTCRGTDVHLSSRTFRPTGG